MASLASTSAFQISQFDRAVELPAPYSPGTPFPISLSPSKGAELKSLIADIHHRTANGDIRSLLTKHSAILFQDLGLKDANEFSRFAHAFGFVEHEDIGNPVRRTILAKNVATANEGPNTQPIYPHNEFGLSPHYPAHPEFIETVEERGIKYQLTYKNGPRDQVESPGTTVLQAYGAKVVDGDDVETVRGKIEEEVRRLPTAMWEWLDRGEGNELGNLRVWQHLPAVRPHPHTGTPSFFNNSVSRFLNAVDGGSLYPPHIRKDGIYAPPCLYGDGSLIPNEYYESAVEIINATRALVSWKQGDVILLDNLAVQHGREPWEGSRRLLASLWDEPPNEP
ncbi:Clavaminate synthase-like protein [Amniculicola lignicola CBS 123094]|uniref:Clavaminate synthase-like protein n=1 Tax=Amniculicola lignicola CBS 123094 TaxID=1392246 RepID=A0A6A5WR04_9PLEO|nr:Clavaminate synthase-like protein [Amniculicola lignicola CBS 123094]